MRIYILFFITYVSYAADFTSYYSPAEVIGKKSIEFGLDGSFFMTTGAYDDAGTLTEVDTDSSFNRLQSDIYAKYGLGTNLELHLGTKYRQNMSVSGDNELSISGFESYFIGGKYSFNSKNKWKFALSAYIRKSLYKNSDTESNSQIILGDAGNDFKIGTHIRYKIIKHHYISGSLLYRVPPADLSHELNYLLESSWQYDRAAFVIGVNGVFSLQNGSYASDPDSRPSLKTGNTSLYNAVNKSYVKPFVGLNVFLGKITIGVNGGQRMFGKNTDQGYEIEFIVRFNKRGVIEDSLKISQFKEYEVEATVIKLSPRGKFIKIDQGLSSDINKGMRFDIYKSNYFGKNLLVASGIVKELGTSWTVIQLTKKYKEIKIKEGFIARGY